jgi:autotransporter-associated beta strand protein
MMKDRGDFNSFRLFGSSTRRRASEKRRRCHLQVEVLEQRTVPTTYAWKPTAPGTFDWNSAANWGGAGYPHLADDVANLTSALTGNETVNLNVPITVGTLNIGASSGASSFVVKANGGSLTLQTSSGSAAIAKTSGGTDTVQPSFTMASPLSLTNNAGNDLDISGNVLNTSNNLTVGGSGNMTFAGLLNFTAVNGADGSTGTVTKNDSGTVTFTNNLAFGTLDTFSLGAGGGGNSGIGVEGTCTTGNLFVNGGDLEVGNIRFNDLNNRGGGFRGVVIAAGASLTSTGTVQVNPRGDITGDTIYGPGTLRLRNFFSGIPGLPNFPGDTNLNRTPSLEEDVGPNGGDAGPDGDAITAVIDVGDGVPQYIVGKTDRNDVSRWGGDMSFRAPLTGSATVQFVGLNNNNHHQQSFNLTADSSGTIPAGQPYAGTPAFTGEVRIADCFLALDNPNALTTANKVTFDSMSPGVLPTDHISGLFLYGHNVTIGSISDQDAPGSTGMIVNGARDLPFGWTNKNNAPDPAGLASPGGGTTYNPGLQSPAVLTIDQQVDGSFNGRISDGGNDNPTIYTDMLTLSIVKQGPAKLTLTGTNAYSGSTTIAQGTLSIASVANGGSPNVIDSSNGLETNPNPNGGGINLDGSPSSPAGGSAVGASTNAAGKVVLAGGTLQYTGTGSSSDRLITVTGNGNALDASGTGGVDFTNSGANAISGSGPTTLTLTGSGTAANIISSVISDGSGGPTSVVKTGAGTWDLAGANTYTGTTHVSAGTLLVDGTVVSPVTVDAGATLGGAGGTLSGSTTVNGVLAAGNVTSPTGQLTVSNLAVGATGALNFDLNGTTAGSGYDQLTVTGSPVTLAPGAALNISSILSFNPTGGTLFDILVNNTGAKISGSFGTMISGTFQNLAEGTQFTVNGKVYQITYVGGASGKDVVLMRIPPVFEWVDSRWTVANGFHNGDTVHPDPLNPATTATVGTNGFSSINAAVAVVPQFGQINVLGNYDSMGFGTFHEAVNLAGPHSYTLDTYDGPVTIDSLAGASFEVIEIDAGNPLTVGNATNTEYDGLIFGAGTFTKVGAGTLILGGTDALTTTTITGGILRPGSSATFGQNSNVNLGGSGTLQLHGVNVTLGQLTGTGTVENAGATPATLTIAGSGSFTYGGVLQNGTGGAALGLTMAGSGTFSLTGTASSYTGLTTAAGGMLSVAKLANGGSNSSIGASSNDPANIVLNGGTLQYTGSSTTIDRGFTVGAGGGTFSFSTAGSTLTVTGGLNNSTNPLTVGGTGNITFTGVFTGTSGALTKSGSGTVNFTNPQALGTIDNATTIGVLRTGNIVVNGGNLQVIDIKVNEAARGPGVREIAIAAGATFTSTGTINIDPGDSTYNTQIAGPGSLQLRNTTSSLTHPSIADDNGPNGGDGGPWGSIITAAVDTGSGGTQWIIGETNRNDVIRYAGDLRFDAPLTGSGGLQFVGLNVNGHRNMHWVLNADNTGFTGAVSIANCDLELANNNALTGANAVTFDSTNNPSTYNTAALYLWGHSVTIGSLNDTSDPATQSYIRNGSLAGLTAGGTNSSTNPVTFGVQLGLDANSTLTIHQTTNGVFNGQVNDGWTDDPEDFGNLQGHQADLPYDTLSIVKTGSGTLSFNGRNTLVTLNPNDPTPPPHTTVLFKNGYNGSTTISGGTLSVDYLVDGGGAVTVYGVGTSTSGLGSSDPGPSDLILDSGTLRYTGSGASTDRQFTVTANGATLDASGTGPINFTSPFSDPFQGTATLTLTGTNAGANKLNSALGDGTGPTTLVKTGSGTWDLTGTDAYTGQTNVLQGTLDVDGMLTGSTVVGGVNVSSGATLGGVGGSIAANTAVSGTLNPGNATSTTGQLSLAGLTFAGASSTFVADLYGTTPGSGYDQVSNSGPVSLSGATLLVNVGTGFNPAPGTQFDILVNTSGSAPGTFAGLSEGATVTATNGARLTITYKGGSGHDVVLTYNAAGASSLVVTSLSSTTVAGGAFLFTVQALDSLGHPTSAFSGPVTFSAADPQAILPGSVALSNGFGFFVGSLNTVAGGPWTITAMGGAGTVTGTSSAISVTPGAAAKLGFGVQPVSTPTGNKLPAVTVQIEDAYGNVVTTGAHSTDAVTLAVASGPSTFTPASTTTVSAVSGVATFNNLTLPAPGTYTFGAIVPQYFTGLNSNPFSVAPLQVVSGSFVPMTSGFSLQFNTTFLVNSQTPVLYGQGFGATAPAPTVTLTQTIDVNGNAVNIPVEGSLVLNPANNSLTFVATNTAYEVNSSSPVLPDGTYTVDVRSSGTTGLQGLLSGSGYLDGLGSGTPGSGDYLATFTLRAAGKDALWVPTTADGPGQPLVAPGNNQIGGGYPVYLNDSTGSVTDVRLSLNYDPTLLTVTGVTGAGFTLLPSSVPGRADLEYNGPALPSGDQLPVGFITASVPKGTAVHPVAYKAKDLLHLSNVSLNGGAISVVTSDAVHLVAYVGDADGNGTYSSADAVLITRVGLQTDSGFTAYPLVDPVIVADTDGSGFIPADAALQVNEAGVGFATANLANPPIPAGVVFVPIGNNVDPTISIPSRLQAGPDGTVTVPVNLDDAHPAGSTGLTEAHLALTYNPQWFTVTAADIRLGSLLAAGSGWTLTPTINPTTGEIAIALSSSVPILSTAGGSLVTINFHQIADTPAAAPSAAISLVSWVNPCGSQVVLTELGDAQGTFTLSPAPINGFDPRIDGRVLGMEIPATPVMHAETVSVETPVINRSEAETSATEPVRPAVTGEIASSSEQADSSGPIGLAETPGHGLVHALPLAESFLLIAALPSGGTYPASVVSSVAGAGLTPALTEPFFQALARVAGIAADSGLAVPRSNTPEFDFLRTASVNSLDMNWDALTSDWSWPTLTPREPAAGTVRTAHPPSADVALATVDQYFMQEPDDVTPEISMD